MHAHKNYSHSKNNSTNTQNSHVNTQIILIVQKQNSYENL